MRKEFVYSVMALGAIPITVNAADVQTCDVQASTDGSKVTYPVGKLVPGSYTFSAKLTSKVYGVQVKIAGKTADVATANNPAEPNVTINFNLTEETDVELELVSTDPGEAGAGFTVAEAKVILNFNLAKAKEDWATAIGKLKTKNVPAYPYDSDDDVKAADKLIEDLNKIDDTYENYVNLKLYQDASVPQGQIDALAATIADHQNTQAYNDVNAEITKIKNAYNAAVADVKAKLVNEAAYLLVDALADLDTNINAKITEATQASYASYTGKTAVADKDTNKGKIPKEEQINDIVNNWEGQAVDNQTAYNNLHAKVTGFQTRVNNVKPKSDGIAAAYPTTEAEAAIAALNTKIENAKNSAAQLDLNVTTEEAAAETKVSNLESKVAKANDEFDANKATTDAIAVVQKAYNDAKTAVDAKVSKDGDYKAADYYAAYLKTQQDAINKLTSDAAAAYKVNGTGTAQKYNEGLAAKTAPITTAISAYQTNAIAAVGKYDDLQTAIAAYEKDLADARTAAQEIGPDVYTDANYDYETQFDLIQKRINDIKKAITAAMEKKGAEHWGAMQDIDADAAITTDIATLLANVQGDQNKYDANTLAEGVGTLDEAIKAFKAKAIDDKVLGDDYATFAEIENGIETAYNAVVAEKAKIAENGKTVDFTSNVGKAPEAWSVNSVNNSNKGTYNGGGITMVEHFGDTTEGIMLSQDVNVENGTYDIKVYATSHNAHSGSYMPVSDSNPAPALQENADDVAYVFAKSGNNEVKTKITAKKSGGFVAGEPEVYTIPGVKVENGKLTIGLGVTKKGMCEWHTIQIESLIGKEDVVTNYIKTLDKTVADLNKQQTDLETFAAGIEAKVAANAEAKTGLTAKIGDNASTPKTGLWKTIDDFKNKYHVGAAESELGNKGKAGGAITTEVADIEAKLATLQQNNGDFDPTKVTEVPKKDAVNTHKAANGWNTGLTKSGNFRDWDVAGIASVEHWIGSADNAETGEVFYQTVNNLPNGIYTVELYANAVDQASGAPNKGSLTNAYVYANNGKKEVPVTDNATADVYTMTGVLVTDGTLKLGLVKAKPGTNWHSIQIKSLTYRENDQLIAYTNTDSEDPGFTPRYNALEAQVTKLVADAPGIKDAVKANADAKTAAELAVTNLQTAETTTLKSLKNVTNAEAVSDDATALKEAPAGYSFKVFATGLEAGKSYTEKKAAIDADIAAMSQAIADSAAAETLAKVWKDNSITVTKKVGGKDVTTTYSIATLTTAINNLKAEAEAESANWEAYKALLDNNMAKLLPDTITVNAADMGAGAVTYYQGLKDSYIDAKAKILTRMQTALTKREAVSKKEGFVEDITALIAKVKVVKSDGIANKKKYDEQVAAYTEVQTLWNNTYTEIAATDKSSKAQDYLDQLDKIQVTLTAATDAVEANYPKGLSVAKEQNFGDIKKDIENVKAQQAESYSTFVALDNANAHAKFTGGDIKDIDGNIVETVEGAIQNATKAYNNAVAERAKYSSTDATVQGVIENAAAELDEALYNCPTQIETLKGQEQTAYEGTVSPAVFDVNNYCTQAVGIAENITTKLEQFQTTIKGALNTFWTGANYKPAFAQKVSDAKDAIDGYSDDAKKDAFKDVEDLIKQGDDGVEAINLAKVEEAVSKLSKINDMLAADKEVAAKKDIEILIAAADKKYGDVKKAINDVNIADDYGNVKATQLAALEAAYDDGEASDGDVAFAKTLDKTFANHDTAADILKEFITTATGCQTAVENAVTNDKANTEAYNDIDKALVPVEEKLVEAMAAAAPYKYPANFTTAETWIKEDRETAEAAKRQGYAVNYKAMLLNYIIGDDEAIDNALTNAFDNEKTGLGADITELKNQYNAYVAANGLDATATAFKKDIDDLETALGAAEIVDLDDPADGNQYDEILAATAALIKLQNDIADKETELLAANASTANADVLKDFQDQIAEMEAAASLEGNDPWVGEQKVGGKAISDHIAEIQAQIADVKAAIKGENNISFYKDQYQAKLDAIKDVLDPVADAIADNQAKFTANAEAYKALTGIISDLDKAIDEAKAKVGKYDYVGKDPNYADFIGLLEYYGDPNDPTKLTDGAKYDLDQISDAVENANKATNAQNYDIEAALEATGIVKNIQDYLDNSANAELDAQILALRVALASAMNVGQGEEDYEPKYSSALWGTLLLASGVIDGEIDDLDYAVEYSNSDEEWDENGDPIWDDDLGENVPKDVTSDADYADQMEVVNAIKQEIADLATAVDNIGLLGDANEDTKVNVLDYQKVVNMILDPTQQPEEETNLFANVDINQNEIIEVGDLTAIVNYILTGDWQGYAAARSMNAEGESIAMNVSPMEQGKQRIAVSLANVSDYTAFQMDMVLPEGMTFVGASLSNRAGESHKLYSRAQLDGSIRVLASSIKGETFSGNEGAVLYIDVEGAGNVELVNILFSDVNAQTHLFTIGGDATGINNVSTFESLKQQVYDFGGRLVKGLKKGMNIIRRNDGSTDKVIVK